ncbi:MAG: hypothetical protein NVSMB53_05970 [Gemmatimonadaceae bacterium]
MFWSPLKRGERDAPPRVEANAFALEKASLELSVLWAGADGTLSIYHALPQDGVPECNAWRA